MVTLKALVFRYWKKVITIFINLQTDLSLINLSISQSPYYKITEVLLVILFLLRLATQKGIFHAVQ
jgi:hypothetical protein